MSNMSYCRFHNTLRDLRDCADALQDGKQLSSEEAQSALDLIAICKEVADEFGEYTLTHLKGSDTDDEY